MITEFLVTTGEARKRLDLFLLNREREMSRTELQRLITLGRVRLNARIVKPGHKIKPGDRITWDTPQPGPLLIHGESVALEILYEDDAILVVNKPPGIVVHPTSGNWTGTLLNAVLAHVRNWNDSQATTEHSIRPGIVHRLDKDTSGVMVIAKTDAAHRALSQQFEQHTIHRTYEALVWNVPEKDEGIIDLAIGRDRHKPRQVSPNSADPKRAITRYKVKTRFGEAAAHLLLYPRTGRTHQLRVHMATLGCHIIGDQVYGKRNAGRIQGIEIPGMMLHAGILGFHHPVSGHYQEYQVEFPPDMLAIRQALVK